MSSSSENNDNAAPSEFQINLATMRRLRFFAGFNPEALKVLAYLCIREGFGPGETIFSQHEPSGQAVCICQGEAEIIHERPPDTYVIRRAGAGEFLGSQALIAPVRPLFTLRAIAATECLLIQGKHFRRATGQFPELLHHMLGIVAESIRQWEERFLAGIDALPPASREKLGVSLL